MLERLVAWRRRAAQGPPSRTSQLVALARAELDRPATPTGDPEAQRRLCEGMSATIGPGLAAHMAARTGFVDRAVLGAVEAGIPQVVVCGAGYDDRALRFHSPGTRFFELDQPSTQADKARRVRRIAGGAGPTFVPVDLRDGDVAERLAQHGHRADRPSLFVCEGLLAYLERDAIASLLGALAARAPAGSRLAATLSIHRDGLDSARVVEAANARRRSAAAEPWRTILPRDAHLALLEEAGWRAEETDLAPSVSPTGRGSTLLVLARPAR